LGHAPGGRRLCHRREGHPRFHFGFDIQGVGGWFDSLPKRGVDEMVEETDEWKLVRNGAGAILKWWKHKSGTPEHAIAAAHAKGRWTHFGHLFIWENMRRSMGDIALDVYREHCTY